MSIDGIPELERANSSVDSTGQRTRNDLAKANAATPAASKSPQVEANLVSLPEGEDSNGPAAEKRIGRCVVHACIDHHKSKSCREFKPKPADPQPLQHSNVPTPGNTAIEASLSQSDEVKPTLAERIQAAVDDDIQHGRPTWESVEALIASSNLAAVEWAIRYVVGPELDPKFLRAALAAYRNRNNEQGAA